MSGTCSSNVCGGRRCSGVRLAGFCRGRRCRRRCRRRSRCHRRGFRSCEFCRRSGVRRCLVVMLVGRQAGSGARRIGGRADGDGRAPLGCPAGPAAVSPTTGSRRPPRISRGSISEARRAAVARLEADRGVGQALRNLAKRDGRSTMLVGSRTPLSGPSPSRGGRPRRLAAPEGKVRRIACVAGSLVIVTVTGACVGRLVSGRFDDQGQCSERAGSCADGAHG